MAEVEQKYHVSFSYADETVRDLFIPKVSNNLSNEQLIDFLESKTGLTFQLISAGNYAIASSSDRFSEICGFVVDAGNAQKIPRSTIESLYGSAITDNNGYFTLKVHRQSDTIRVRSVGYEILEQHIQDSNVGDSCMIIELQQVTIRLKEVVISNFLTRGIDINSDGSLQINAATLGLLPGLTDPDVLQTIQALPGIQSVNETVSDINVRGGTNDQNLIFWDGIRMYQSGHFFGLISAFNPYLTSGVQLIKNGTSAAIGEGVSSTIDIKTDNKVNKEISGGAGVNMLNGDFFLKVPISKKAALHISGRRSISDLVKTPTYSAYFDRVFRNTDVLENGNTASDTLVDSEEQFDFYDFSAKFLYDISEKDKLRINFLKVFNTISYEESAVVGNIIQSKTSGLTQGTIGSRLNYQRHWNSFLSSSLQVYYSAYDLEAINFDVVNDQRLYQENEIKDAGIKLDTRIVIDRAVDLFVGYQFSEVGISNLVDINNPLYRRHIKKVLRTNTLFAEGNFTSVNGNTNLRLGLRASHFDKFKQISFEPRIAFSQYILKNLTFEVLGEVKSQTSVQIIDLPNDFLGVEKRRWILSNDDDIPIIKSRQISFGLRYNPGGLLLSVEPYYKYVNGISSSSQGFQNQYQFVRSNGLYSVFGYDVLINQNLGKFNSWISYSFADNKYDFPDFSPSSFPNNLDIRHSVTFGAAYETKNIHLSAGVNYRTGKPYTKALNVEGNEIIYENPNNSRLDEYLRLDISAIYKFALSSSVRGEFGGSIWNLTNNQNIVNTYYQLDNDQHIREIQQNALGITPNIMFRVYF